MNGELEGIGVYMECKKVSLVYDGDKVFILFGLKSFMLLRFGF